MILCKIHLYHSTFFIFLTIVDCQNVKNDDECQRLRGEGLCESNTAEMINQCQRACNLCPLVELTTAAGIVLYYSSVIKHLVCCVFSKYHIIRVLIVDHETQM